MSRLWPVLVALLLLVGCSRSTPVPGPGPTQGSPSAGPATGSSAPTAVPDATPPTPPANGPSPTPTGAPSPATSPSPAAAAPVLRGTWVQLFSDTLKTPGGVDAMLEAADAAHVNTVIAEVVRRQDAYYTSSVLPRSTDTDLAAGFDPLARLVDGAHARGMALEAWVPLMPTYHHVYDDLPHPSGWVYTEHGPNAPVEQRWVTRMADGTWDDHLDPGVPAARDHLVAMVTEIARRYDVDAVHLDYLRYTDQAAGYNPAALAAFRADTGREDTPSPTDPQFSDWRREQTRSLLERIRASVHDAAPHTAVTAAVIAQGEGPHAGRPFTATRAYAEYYQDWPSWVRDGLLDAAMPMDYFDARTHQAWFDQWAAFAGAVAQQATSPVALGIGAWLNRPEDGLAQMATGLEQTDGAVVYSYQQNAESEPYDALLGRLRTTLWKTPAPPPDLAP